jgi:FlaA1/EpsC-like NDP-sugar epimerase
MSNGRADKRLFGLPLCGDFPGLSVSSATIRNLARRGLVGRSESIAPHFGGTLLPLLKDQHFLITGGTGSFGQTMVARLLQAGAEEVRVLSRDEAKQDDLIVRSRPNN